MDLYTQFVPESQKRAVGKMMKMVERRMAAKAAVMPDSPYMTQ